MKSFKFTVRVMPARDVLDSQGRAVEETLRRMGADVVGVRVGKSIDLELKAESFEGARSEAHRIAKELLSNPLTESFELQEGSSHGS